MKYFDFEGNVAKFGDDVKKCSFEALVPGILPIKIRKILFPEMNFMENGIAKVLVEYQESDFVG